jgi:hypothetical protein
MEVKGAIMYRLEVTEDEANTIMRGLGQLKAIEVFELIVKLQSQAKEQEAEIKDEELK